MGSLFAKLIVSVSLLLGIAAGNLYIDSSISSINLAYSDGDKYPVIYNLDIENIGPERARFDIESDTPWIFVYKDYELTRRSIQVSPGDTVRFIVEIHPEQAGDGIHNKEVIFRVFNPLDSSLYEERGIPVVINKNVIISSPSAEVNLEETEGIFQKLRGLLRNLII